MLVSIVIPCYNVQDYIEECLQSVYAQTYSKIEIICVDNNSTDNTFDILKEQEALGKTRLFRELKKGAPAARNLGLKHAKGEWIQFLDADDLLLPNKISHQMDLIKENTHIGFEAGAFIKLDLNGNSKTTLPFQDKYLGLLKANLGITSANLFHRLTLNNIGDWNENIGSSQEYDLMFRLIKNGSEVIYDNDALTIIRERESGQITHGNPKKKWIQYVNLRIEIIEFLKIKHHEFYIKHLQNINQILFDAVRILVKYDLKKANTIYKKYLIDFIPVESKTTTKSYLMFYHLFGFSFAEKIKRLIK